MPLTSSPASPRHWNVFLPAGIAMALSVAGDLTLYAVLPAYASQLGLALGSLGVLLSANRLIRLISNPLVGWLGDRFRRRKMLLCGLTTGVISTLLYVAARGFWVFLLGRMLWGVSWSILYIGTYCIILDVSRAEERGWGAGLLQTFYFTGVAVTPAVGGFLSDQLGLIPALLACAAIQGAGLLGALLFLPETHPAGAGGKPAGLPLGRLTGRPIGRLPAVRPTFSFNKLRDWAGRWLNTLRPGWLWRNGPFLSANYLYLLTLFIGDGIIMSTITLYLKQRYGEGIAVGQGLLPVATAGGILIALRAAVSAGAAPLAGAWSDRAGLRWVVAGWGALIAIAGCVFLAVDGRFWMIIVGILLAAFGSGMLMAVLPAIASSLTTGQPNGMAMSLLATSGDIGSAVAPLASYALLNRLSLAQLYLISAGLLVSGALLALGILWRSRAAHSHEGAEA